MMGVVNVTPDSFSDGGMYFHVQAACERIDQLVEEGAQIIDVGAESTRPGSEPVSTDEQIRRAMDAVQHAAGTGALVSIDTTDPEVARVAIEHGASIINDVSCLREGDGLAKVAASYGATLIIMHARENMSLMKGFSVCPSDAYTDIVDDVRKEWLRAAKMAEKVGVEADELLFDPGLGFNKNAEHSNALLARLNEFSTMGYRIVVGPSRKSFLACDVSSDPSRRLGGTIAACLACGDNGADVVRVHDVLEVKQAFAVARALARPLCFDRKSHA